MDSYNDVLMELPKQIGEVNKELMNLTMEVCYEELHSNEKDIDIDLAPSRRPAIFEAIRKDPDIHHCRIENFHHFHFCHVYYLSF
mgnify:CR=1 FL=1